MTQRLIARLCQWVMILAGIIFVFSVFAVPRFAAAYAADDMPLPWYLNVTFAFSGMMLEYSWLLIQFYLLLFALIVVWSFTTKSPRTK